MGRVRITGDPIEDTASALVLASKMNGKAVTDEDIAAVLEHNGHIATGANIAAVRKRLPN